MTNKEIDRYYIDRSGSIRKSVIVYEIRGSLHTPILYISKPRWLTDSEFNETLDRVQILIKER